MEARLVVAFHTGQLQMSVILHPLELHESTMYRFDDGRYALRACSASRAYLLSSNLFGTCPRPSEQNALIRKPLYKRYFLMRKLSKIVQHTLENSKCIQQENENVCDTHRAYGSSIWVGYAASSKSSGHPADSTGSCGMLPRVEKHPGPTC